MWLFDKFFDILQYFGFFKKSAKILFVGLDNAGKTTLLHLLKYGRLTQNVPTARPTCESLSLGPIDFKAFDLGGHEQARILWREYFDVADAIVFLIDVSDPERLEEARKELKAILGDPGVPALPILILGNKIDKEGALSKNQLLASLNFSGVPTGNDIGQTRWILANGNKVVEVFMCSLVEKQGYGEGFRWLADVLS